MNLFRVSSNHDLSKFIKFDWLYGHGRRREHLAQALLLNLTKKHNSDYFNLNLMVS